MLQYFLKKIQNKLFALVNNILALGANVDKANELVGRGEFVAAVGLFKKYLRRDPHNFSVLLALSYCYQQLGEKRLANETSAHAYALDDTFIPAIFKRASDLVDSNQSELALPLLSLLKDDPVVADGVNTLLSGICMNRGDAFRAKEFQMSSWLANFDDLRNANCYVFRLAYNNSDETTLAQEHQFWAETLSVASSINESIVQNNVRGTSQTTKEKDKRLRIGYWGSDFREHSVRYFSRPLIANHNAQEFKVFIYNENFLKAADDAQTVAFRATTDEFHDVAALTDDAVVELIFSHELDVLVDLVGHTSANRLHLLKKRLATVQITGLAYPPTTGLKSIDAKLMDPHIWTADASHFYAENPLVLPESLWCFDPMEDVPYSKIPPVLQKGHITFGCFGNVAKITPPILNCWQQILNQLPASRLIIQSPTFNDPDTLKAFSARLVDAGITEVQIELRGPTFGPNFWAAYTELDIVLDTYPFNGGTTTCFSAYAGVPIITLAGKSLISRVGRSVMTNLGYPDLVVDRLEDYAPRVLRVAQDVGFLTAFREQARERFKKSSLGNGKKFAKEFEAACKELLTSKKNGSFKNISNVPALPADVLLQRAETVWYHGNVEAAKRILQTCMQHYPNCEGVYLLEAKQQARERRHHDAILTIENRLNKFNETEIHDALLLLARFYLILNRTDKATHLLDRQKLLKDDSVFQKMQSQLLRSAVKEPSKSQRIEVVTANNMNILVLVPCTDEVCFKRIRQQIQENCPAPADWRIVYEWCNLNERITTYNEISPAGEVDVVILMQRNLMVFNPNFFRDVISTLETCDVLGCAGALRWVQKDWTLDNAEYRAWGIMRPGVEADNLVELQFAGVTRQKIVPNAVVLDGKFLAFKAEVLGQIKFDENLFDKQTLAEEDWSNRVHAAGYRVSVHKNLGLLINTPLETYPLNTTQGQRNLIDRLNWDPLALSTRDFRNISVPVQSAELGYMTAREFLE